MEPVETALYFPYIQVPREDWFTPVLLYWDRIASIVPYRLEPAELGEYMHQLLNEGLVDPVRPDEAQTLNGRHGFDDQFMELLESSPLPRSHPPYRWSRIHREKARRQLFESMKGLGLAEGPYGRYDEWWRVEEQTAGLYMLHLVGSICRYNRGLFPVTDTRLTLTGLTEPLDDKSSRLQDLRYAAIMGALPAPSGRVSPRELASFKGTHQDQLRKLHNHLNEKLKELADIDNDQLRQSATTKVLAEIRDDVRVLREQMSRQWPRIILTSVAGLILGGLGLGAAVASGGTALALGLGVANVVGAQVPAAAGIAKSIHFKKEALRHPLAYAVLAQEALNTPVNEPSSPSAQAGR